MVRVSPPPRSLGSKTKSAMAVASHEQRIDQECDQLLLDIRRIEPEGESHVLFGKLFDDDQAQQYYEALVGTLKCAKKRGYITFKGQMLLKGMHDNVKISIVEKGDSKGEGKPALSTSNTSVSASPKRKPRPKPIKVPSLAEIAAKAAEEKETVSKPGAGSEQKKNTMSDAASQKESQSKHTKRPPKPSKLGSEYSFSPTSSRKQLRRKGAITQEDRVCSSDSEAVPSQDEYGVGGASDSECLVGLRSPRRLVLPKIFMAEDCRPPAGWRRRDSDRRATIATTRGVLKSKENSQIPDTADKKTTNASEPEKAATPSARKSLLTLSKPTFSPQRKMLTPSPSKTTTARSATNTLTPPRNPTTIRSASETLTPPKPFVTRSLSRVATPPKPAISRSFAKKVATPPKPANTRTATKKVTTPPIPSRYGPPRRAVSLPVGRSNGAQEASALIDDEVVKLLVDIRRVGANPGEPTVTFGELFDDDDVQNTYEALVGTLRSAKRRGLISFKGQMLLKGMHDSVVISVVDTGASASN